jgi:hypothetical protein
MDNALEFCLRLARAHATIIRRLDTVLGGHHGLSFSDFMLLQSLANAPGGRLRRVDLADRLGLTASGVTRTLLPPGRRTRCACRLRRHHGSRPRAAR